MEGSRRGIVYAPGDSITYSRWEELRGGFDSRGLPNSGRRKKDGDRERKEKGKKADPSQR